MSCGCKELEATHGNGKCKCVHYRKHFPNCKCEEESVSEHSPGPVSNEEVLVRTIFNPDHVDSRGSPTPTYFQDIIKDFTVRGLSINRRGHVTEPDLRARLKNHPGNKHDYMAFIAAKCGDLRRLAFGNERAFCVYDSGTAEDCSHVDVCQSTLPEIDATRREAKEQRMRTARMLRNEFSEKVAKTLTDVRPRLDWPAT